jgi:hypothetical protein
VALVIVAANCRWDSASCIQRDFTISTSWTGPLRGFHAIFWSPTFFFTGTSFDSDNRKSRRISPLDQAPPTFSLRLFGSSLVDINTPFQDHQHITTPRPALYDPLTPSQPRHCLSSCLRFCFASFRAFRFRCLLLVFNFGGLWIFRSY